MVKGWMVKRGLGKTMLRKTKNKNNGPLTINHLRLTSKAQVILEFTFCMIIILLMIYGVVKVFQWAGRDVAERQIAHENSLIRNVSDPRDQIGPVFYMPRRMNAIWDGK